MHGLTHIYCHHQLVPKIAKMSVAVLDVKFGCSNDKIRTWKISHKLISWWLLSKLIFGRPEATFTDIMKYGRDCCSVI
jgi:hypothetical protein